MAMIWSDLFSVVLIAFGLSADCFAVAVGIGASGKIISRRLVLRLALAFGIFQMCMPLAGWLAGQTVVQFIERFDHWIAFALLLLVGGKMVWEFIENKTEAESTDISRWGTLLTLAFATSVDALAVGLSFAFLKLNVLLSSAIIGVVAFIVTAMSFWLGRRAGALMGRWAQLIGGLILIGIGTRILISHLSG